MNAVALVLAILEGLVLAATASADIGRAAVLAICAMQVVLGVVLVLTEAKLWRGAVGRTLLPLAVISPRDCLIDQAGPPAKRNRPAAPTG